MPPAKNNMFLVCVTMGLVLLASKYRKNVFESVKHICQSIKNKSYKEDTNKKNDINIPLDEIILADTPEKCDYAVQRIRCNLSNNVLGFDCEWFNDGPVSLLQLATFNGVCGLFRIGKIGYIPPKLKELLANKHILKVGVASYEDGQKITADYGCRVCGTLDLRSLAERTNLPSPKSLAAMSLQYLGLVMSKLIDVRCGNWNADTLTDEQVAYAACDAIASVLIYDQIVQRIKEKYSLWENIANYIKYICNKNGTRQFYCLPDGIIDTRFKEQKTHVTVDQKKNKNNQPDGFKQDLKAKNIISTNANSIPTRNKPLYHNCYLQAPDGDVLCTCDQKKAEWYINKGLGEMIDQDPFTVRLKFEPSGRALGEVGQYYTQVKINQCVVCGLSDKFIRKSVVPREYRKYFPLVMKAHQSHDILLLCPICHQKSNGYDLQLRRKLSDICDAPLTGPLTHIRNEYINNHRKLRSAIEALREKATLPDVRRKELEQYISECTGQQVTPVLLDMLSQELKNSRVSMSNYDQSKYEPHGLKVVQYFEKKEGGLVELERIWREHFLASMKPKYLPSLWSVCHNQERLTIRQSQNRIEPEDAKAAGLKY
ncbi:exonuclease 3'-5' domain-containing 2 [Megalopta genalis]|uniref:exonuclease 3'-5' domain-containing 2 n=1 Tax=Megalopta genalis TaxID=115081 RepID=UPI003FCEF52F